MCENKQLNFYDVIFNVINDKLILDKNSEPCNKKIEDLRGIIDLRSSIKRKRKENIQNGLSDENIKMMKDETRNKNIRDLSEYIEHKKEQIEKLEKAFQMCDNINKYMKNNKCIERINYYEILPRDITAEEDDIIYESLINTKNHVFDSQDIFFLKKTLNRQREILDTYEKYRLSVADQYC
jgi:hypothetical protein